jgi:hypothetical protein
MHIQLYDEATLLVIFISQSVSQSVSQFLVKIMNFEKYNG